ncbi:conserved hypothetical protein [Histoplasma capsulatum G186AR]|uniref:Guanine nucleotide-exchange factor SEC12 n=1 Tax=Ajellomyces capsulatus (strain G186AR / H82 / ATCC MYA-2454 / RMSCC 2432) TaxID=447093 RepID=C0NE29_AJECG|nr:uncharacterized protein HCBG_02122 [Histoplasma capsulatum G186AR]EEH10477.1 conserved hypothetical protein [Histoplasma capsulatum G186AR]
MAPDISSAKITLSCPLFGVDFDPRNNGFLLVGGGGGEGRSGVGNKIASNPNPRSTALLNTSQRNEISEIANIELSRDEDSVTSLAVSKSNDKSIIALAGINSSVAEQQRDNNEHLRSFQLDYPPGQVPASSPTSPAKSKKGGKKHVTQPTQPMITPLSQASLFKPKYKPKDKRETYQRLLRLSPWKGEEAPRIGVVATGLAPQGEMVVFNATSPAPKESDIVGRIWLEGRDEVEDVDMLPASEGDNGKFKVAFTDGISIYTLKVSASTRSNETPKTKVVYTLPFPDYFARSKKRGKIRALRFLSPTSFLILLNLPDRAGCELAIISLGLAPEGTVVRRTRLPHGMKIGLGLDVCPLSESAMGTRQFIVAVSSNDNSIQILTLECKRKGKPAFSKFRPYATLRNVHPFSMTRLAFSTFTAPAQPVSADVRPQDVKLASISVGNTVVVHSLPVTASPPKSRHPRYVLVQPGPSELLQTLLSGFMALIVVALGAFFLQVFTEIRGGVPPALGAHDWLSPKIRSMIARPYLFENGLSSQYQKWRSPTDPLSISATTTTVTSTITTPVMQITPTQNLRDLLSSLSRAVPEATPLPETPDESALDHMKIVIHEHPDDPSLVAVTTLPHTYGDGDSDKVNNAGAEKAQHPRKWADLHEHEREAWKAKLSAAGHWAKEEGETILRGLFFGQVAGVMAGAVGGMMD